MTKKTGKQTSGISMAGLKVGNVRFYERDGKVFSRVATTRYMPNERTGSQMMNRLRFSSVQILWACFKDILKGSFESVAPGKSAYTTFMKLNHNNGVFLSKEQQRSRFGIITPLHISDGTLEPIQQVMNDEGQVVTSIVVGDFEITEETTVGDLASCISANNLNISYGDELHFVAARQEFVGEERPVCRVEVKDLKLDINDERLLLAVSGKYPLANKDGFLASKTGLETGCYAFYLSREEGQKTLVSPQRLVSNNDEMIEQYISEEQFTLARTSFGKSEDAWIYGWEFKKPTFE